MKKFLGKLFKKPAALALMALTAVMALPVAAGASPPDQSIDFSSGAGFGFSIMDIINSAWSFLAQFDTYTILVLSLILVPTLIGFVIWIISKVPKFRSRAS